MKVAGGMVVIWCGWAVMGAWFVLGSNFDEGCVGGSGLVVFSGGLGGGRVETEVVSGCCGRFLMSFFFCSFLWNS